MAKKIITKKSLIKESQIGSRYVSGLIFFLVALAAIIISIVEVLKPETVSTTNIICTICFDVILFIVFGWCIGLKTIFRAKALVKKIDSPDFVIEIDELIDKYDTNNDLNNSCRAVFKYNESIFPVNRWDEYKKGAQYYIFNLSEKETIVKRVSQYDLDDELKQKVKSDYHIHGENAAEKWEE